MDDIEGFVRKVCAEGDLSVLTKKLVRKQYQAHFHKETVTHEEKDKINQALDLVLQELAENQKVFPTAGSGGCESTSSISPEQGKENLLSSHSGQKPHLASSSPVCRQKVEHMIPRFELGHQHQRHIRLSVKKTTVDVRSSAERTDVDKLASDCEEVLKTGSLREGWTHSHGKENLKTSTADLGETTEGPSVEQLDENSRSQSMGCEKPHQTTSAQDTYSTTVPANQNVTEAGLSEPIKNKILVKTKVLDAKPETDSSQDSISLLPVPCDSGSDNSLPSLQESLSSSKGKQITSRKVISSSDTGHSSSGGISKGQLSSETDSGGKQVCFPRKKLTRRGPPILTFKSALSAIIDSDELDEDLELDDQQDGCKMENASSGKLQNELQDATGNIFEQFTDTCQHSQDTPAGEEGAASQDLGHTLVPSASDGDAYHDSTPIQRTKDQDGKMPFTSNLDGDREENTVSQDFKIVHENSPVFRFTPSSFFGRAKKQKRQSREAKLYVVNSDSELSCDSLSSPLASPRLGVENSSVTSQPVLDKNTQDPDSDDFTLSTLKKRKLGASKMKKSEGKLRKKNIMSDSDGGTPSKAPKIPTRPQRKTEVMATKKKLKTFSKKRKSAVIALSDNSGDDPFSHLKETDQTGRGSQSQKQIIKVPSKQIKVPSKSKESCRSSEGVPQHKFSLFETTSTSEACSTSSDFHFSPPKKRAQKRKRTSTAKQNLTTDRSRSKENNPKGHSVYSLSSESTEDEKLDRNCLGLGVFGKKVGNVKAESTDVMLLVESLPNTTVTSCAFERKNKKERKDEDGMFKDRGESEPWEVHQYDGQKLPDCSIRLEDVSKRQGLQNSYQFTSPKSGHPRLKMSGILGKKSLTSPFPKIQNDVLSYSPICHSSSTDWEHMSSDSALVDVTESGDSVSVSLNKPRKLLKGKHSKEKLLPKHRNKERNHSSDLSGFSSGDDLPLVVHQSTPVKNTAKAKKFARRLVGPKFKKVTELESETVSVAHAGFSSEDDIPLARMSSFQLEAAATDFTKLSKTKKILEEPVCVRCDHACETNSKSKSHTVLSKLPADSNDVLPEASDAAATEHPKTEYIRKTQNASMDGASEASGFNRSGFSSEDDLLLAVLHSADSSQPEEIDKKSQKRKTAPSLDSSDEEQCSPPPKRKKKSAVRMESSDDEGDVSAGHESEVEEATETETPHKKSEPEEHSSSDEDQLFPLLKKKKKLTVEAESSDDEDEVPTEPESETEESIKVEKSQTRVKTAKKKPTSQDSESSDDEESPVKPKQNGSSGAELTHKAQNSDGESELETSSLSSDEGVNDGGDLQPASEPKKKGDGKKQHKNSTSPHKGTSKSKSLKQPSPSSGGEKEEHPYLKRLKLICRKVGIFVRNDVHFTGCTTDKQRIERLKEALKKAGMKGQPSLSKVDSVNLQREAAALDTSNIIQTSGRPRRQPKGLFSRGESPPKSLTPVKQQFSHIKDLVTDSDSD